MLSGFKIVNILLLIFSPEKQHSPTRRSDQSPENPVRKSIYKDIFETLHSDIPVTPQPPKPVSVERL